MSFLLYWKKSREITFSLVFEIVIKIVHKKKCEKKSISKSESIIINGYNLTGIII